MRRLERRGENWEQTDRALTYWQMSCVQVDPDNPKRVYIGTEHSGMFVTSDGGKDWTITAAKQGIAFAISRELGIPISYIGTGEKATIEARVKNIRKQVEEAEDPAAKKAELIDAYRQIIDVYIAARNDMIASARFFRRSGEGVYDMADLSRATEKMAAYVKAFADGYQASRIFGLGFSNGANILANVLIKADKSKLGFKATDLDLEVTETIAAELPVTAPPPSGAFLATEGQNFTVSAPTV